MNAEVKQTFTPVPMVSYRGSKKLSSYLVRSKLYPIDRILGSKGCGKKQFEVCENVCETDTFSSTVTGDTFKFNHKLNCDDKCLIYLFTFECILFCGYKKQLLVVNFYLIKLCFIIIISFTKNCCLYCCDFYCCCYHCL